MEKTTEWTRTGTIPRPDGMDKRTPGVKVMNHKEGTIRSAKVMVNLKTKLMIAQLKRAKTRAWKRTWVKNPAPGGKESRRPGLKRAKRMVGTSTFGPVMSIICINFQYYV
jgi:hypothetical protein